MSISCIVLICLVVLMKLNLNRGPCIQPPASDPNLQLLPPRPPASDPPDLGSSVHMRGAPGGGGGGRGREVIRINAYIHTFF